MTPQFLTVKIQALLGGRATASEMQKRSVAMEYYKLCARAEAQLEHCVALIKAGRDYPALQVAESSGLLDLLNSLMFPELERWRSYCAAEDLPVPPPFDDSQIELVNSLYARGVSQNHPLYRDYRRAMRMRKYEDALAVIKTISKINSYDAEARRECDKLRRKVSAAKLKKLEGALAKNDFEAVLKLYDELQPESELISDSRVWREASEFKRAKESEYERSRCMSIIRELESIDIENDFARASDLVTEFNLIRSDTDFVGPDLEFIEKISKETAVKQNEIIAAEKAARARNLIGIELESPDKSERRRVKLARLLSLSADAGKTLDPESARRLAARISALRFSLRMSAAAKAACWAAAAAGIAAAAAFIWNFAESQKIGSEAENEIAQIEASQEPSDLPKKIESFRKKYPELSESKYAERLSSLEGVATLSIKRRDRVKSALEQMEAIDFKTAPSKEFAEAKSNSEKLFLELSSLSPMEQIDFRDRIESLSKKISAAIDERKAKNSAAIRLNLSKYESIAEEYENFSRAKDDIDRDAEKVLKVLRPLMEDVSILFKPHQLDIEKFNEISVRATDAKNKYAKFDKLKEALETSRTAAEYSAAVDILAESGITPAEFARKLSKIAELKDSIMLGQLVDFGTPEGVAQINSAGIAVRAALPENKMLTDLYKYSRDGKYEVYTIGKITEQTQKWRGGSEIVQQVNEVSAGGRISTKPYRKHFIDGRAPRGEILLGGDEAAESKLGKMAYKEAAQESLLSALTLIGNAKANPIYKVFFEGLIFAKLSENPAATMFEYSPLAKARKTAVERYSKAFFDYSWIFESDSKARLIDAELYSQKVPDYFKDAQTRLNAIKIALENPIMLIGVCDETGKASLFKDPKGAIWSVGLGTGKFERVGENMAACSGKLAPLAPIFSEVKSSAEILKEAARK